MRCHLRPHGLRLQPVRHIEPQRHDVQRPLHGLLQAPVQRTMARVQRLESLVDLGEKHSERRGVRAVLRTRRPTPPALSIRAARLPQSKVGPGPGTPAPPPIIFIVILPIYFAYNNKFLF